MHEASSQIVSHLHQCVAQECMAPKRLPCSVLRAVAGTVGAALQGLTRAPD
jgi:hypothetical protein